ncbi:MAG: tryptophan synthase subunit beta, partial [Planctomycetota bacterium]
MSKTKAKTAPARPGRFGPFGGAYVPETLVPLLDELEKEYARLKKDAAFKKELDLVLEEFAGRPTPLTECLNLAKRGKGARIFLKREDLLHTGAHKLNNALGQALIAKRLGKTRVVAETGAGQHGVATATVCARFGFECVVYMGATDVARQRPNALRMELLGAKLIPVTAGEATLKEATNEAIRDWIAHPHDTYYLLGSCVGPHPYPTLVRDLQRVIGVEARAQAKKALGRLPEHVVACVGGGSNAIGLFHPFLEDTKVKLWGVEAGGRGPTPGEHSATLARGAPGVLHGAKSYLLQDEHGQVAAVHSISAGLDYPGVGPEHAWLKESGRASYVEATDADALEAVELLARHEGIIPALESAHAVAHALRLAREIPKKEAILVGLSGRGDKDLETIRKAR